MWSLREECRLSLKIGGGYRQLSNIYANQPGKSKVLFFLAFLRKSHACSDQYLNCGSSGEAHDGCMHSTKPCPISASWSTPTRLRDQGPHPWQSRQKASTYSLCSKTCRKNERDDMRVLSTLETHKSSVSLHLSLSLTCSHPLSLLKNIQTGSRHLSPYLWVKQKQLLGCVHFLPNSLKIKPTSRR